MSLYQILQSPSFVPHIMYGTSYTNSNWDSCLWGGKNSYEIILSDMHSTGQTQLACLFPSYSQVKFIISEIIVFWAAVNSIAREELFLILQIPNTMFCASNWKI